MIIIAIIAAIPLSAIDMTVYTNAHDLYNRGQFAEALERYKSIARSAADPDIYYDLGATYLALNDVGHAVLWFNRALKRAPDDADTRGGLRMANALTVDRIDAPTTPSMVQAMLFFYYKIPLTMQAILVIVFATLIALSLISFILFDSTLIQRIAFAAGTASIALTILFAASAVVRYRTQFPENAAVVTAKESNVLNGSEDGYTVLITLHAGTVVVIRDVRQKYALITLANGVSGWILREAIERI